MSEIAKLVRKFRKMSVYVIKRRRKYLSLKDGELSYIEVLLYHKDSLSVYLYIYQDGCILEGVNTNDEVYDGEICRTRLFQNEKCQQIFATVAKKIKNENNKGRKVCSRSI